jgi:cytochrome c-type biogenesis protein
MQPEQNAPILVAVGMGLLSFVSPCVLPLIPAYVSYITGLSLEELQAKRKTGKVILRILYGSLAFVLGFSVVFVLLGAGASTFGNILQAQKFWLAKLAGVLIIFFGLHMVGVFKLGFLNYEKKFEVKTKRGGLFTPFLFGLAFSFGWTPCIGPFLASLLVIAANQETMWQGVVLLAFYSAGLGIPFILTALALGVFLTSFRVIQRYFHVIEVIGGILMIVVGLAFLFDMMGWLYSIFPASYSLG